jgi:hypothetical protein
MKKGAAQLGEAQSDKDGQEKTKTCSSQPSKSSDGAKDAKEAMKWLRESNSGDQKQRMPDDTVQDTEHSSIRKNGRNSISSEKSSRLSGAELGMRLTRDAKRRRASLVGSIPNADRDNARIKRSERSTRQARSKKSKDSNDKTQTDASSHGKPEAEPGTRNSEVGSRRSEASSTSKTSSLGGRTRSSSI